MHFTVWLVLDMGLLWGQIAGDLVKRWYIVIGMSALIMMVPLALTSNDWAVRKMGGANWRRLHKAVYAIVLLGATHNVMAQKVWEVQPILYVLTVLVLLAMRVKLPSRPAWKLRVAG
jgi:sulfoxide reductase heme-binding subunit YedZ